MSCIKPTVAWQDMMSFTKAGKHPVIFSYKDLDPRDFEWRHDDEKGEDIFLSDRYRSLSVPCGKCLLCRKTRSWEISVRALLEWQANPFQKACFITLTVDDDHMHQVFPGMVLRHRPWQLFAKRLRKKCGSFRFLMCGEYGEHTRRPHYHAVIYGHDFTDRTWNYEDGTFCDSPLLRDLWSFGQIQCRSVNKNAIMYVAGYQLKLDDAVLEPDDLFDVDLGDDDDKLYLTSYVRWSRRPGLGMPFLEKYPDLFRIVDWKCEDGFTVKKMSPSICLGKSLSWFDGRYFKKVLDRCANDEKFIGKIDEDLRLLLSRKFATLQSLEDGWLVQKRLHSSPSAKEVALMNLKNREKLNELHLARKSRDLVA